ncbi:MAG: sulfotransferase [Magnetococcales bacterium]|nr:sulfotransferase [Magnetococcales bacterium]
MTQHKKAHEAILQGISLHQANSLPQAIVFYEKALKFQANNAIALSNMALALQSLGEVEKAATNFKKAIKIKPDYSDAHYNLGNLQQEQGDLSQAIKSYEKAIAINPNNAVFHCNLGNAIYQQSKLEKAAISYKKAIALQPDFAMALSNLALIQTAQGQVNAAILNHQKAIAAQPSYAKAHYNLSRTKKDTGLTELQLMQDLLAHATNSNDKMYFNFAMGQALLNIKKYPQAFACFVEANNHARSEFHFDINDEKFLFTYFHKFFNADFFKKRESYGHIDKTPIFIVGMPRSGSTLIEQILASHPDVYGAGELHILKEILLKNTPSNLINQTPETIAQKDFAAIDQLGAEYINKLRDINQNAKFIINKLPANFLYIGIIKLLLPNAKIIHSTRNPADTCLSIFQIKFSEHQPYAYNLVELGQYYRLYSEMMNHWHTLFPGFIYDLCYENLIVNQEGETRKLLQFCGLDWQNSCLDFFKNSRQVESASNIQVRNPIYPSSVKRWQRFERELKPLLDVLGDLNTEN